MRISSHKDPTKLAMIYTIELGELTLSRMINYGYTSLQSKIIRKDLESEEPYKVLRALLAIAKNEYNREKDDKK